MSQSPFSNTPQNPYQSPAPVGPSYDAPAAGEEVSRRSIALLKETRPWVRFLSIVTFLGTGLMVVGGLLFVVMSIGQGGPAETIGAAFFYVVGGLLYFVGAFYLWRYADCIRRLEVLRTVRSLEEALAVQKSFWKYTGILMAVVLGFYAVVLVIALVVGLAAFT